jgi:hypothetical protein
MTTKGKKQTDGIVMLTNAKLPPFIRLDSIPIMDAEGKPSTATFQRADGHWQVAMGKGAWAGIADPHQIEQLENLARAKVMNGTVQVSQDAKGAAVIQTKNEIEFKKLAQEIIADTVKIGEKWLSLCIFIREHQIEKKDATQWLLDLGFHKSKASEVIKVASTPPELFSKFQARLLGWRGVLSAARGDVDNMKQAVSIGEDVTLKTAVAEVAKEVAAHDDLIKKTVEQANKGKTPEQIKAELDKAKAQAAKDALERAGVMVLNRANSLKINRSKTWRDGIYTLTLTVAKKTGPKSKTQASIPPTK